MINNYMAFVATMINNSKSCSYTVQGPGRAGSRPFLLALTLAPGRLDPGPGGSGQGRVRADPGPLIFSSELNIFFSNAVILVFLLTFMYC